MLLDGLNIIVIVYRHDSKGNLNVKPATNIQEAAKIIFSPPETDPLDRLVMLFIVTVYIADKTVNKSAPQNLLCQRRIESLEIGVEPNRAFGKCLLYDTKAVNCLGIQKRISILTTFEMVHRVQLWISQDLVRYSFRDGGSHMS